MAFGFSVATRVVALYDTTDGTTVVPSRRTNVVPLTPVTASLNVAVRFPVWLTERAPEAGVRAVTVGATNSVRGVTATERADADPVPAVVAATSKVYAVPLVSPVTIAGWTLPTTVWVRPGSSGEGPTG